MRAVHGVEKPQHGERASCEVFSFQSAEVFRSKHHEHKSGNNLKFDTKRKDTGQHNTLVTYTVVIIKRMQIHRYIV